jgi:tetratricopeptide (TPR) repeat protein
MEPINWRQYHRFLTQAFCTGDTSSAGNGHGGANGHSQNSHLRRLSPATASRLLELLLERKYRRYLERHPDDVEARVRLAFLLYFRGVSDEVEMHCRRALELSPNFAPAYLVLGLEYRARQEWQRAREMFQRAVELAPHMAAARQFLLELDAEQRAGGEVAARSPFLVR